MHDLVQIGTQCALGVSITEQASPAGELVNGDTLRTGVVVLLVASERLEGTHEYHVEGMVVPAPGLDAEVASGETAVDERDDGLGELAVVELSSPVNALLHQEGGTVVIFGFPNDGSHAHDC